MSEREHDHQKALFDWAWLQRAKYPELEMLYAIPNGGKRGKATAGKLKAEGVKAGVFDVALDVGRAGYLGLRIEMKTQTGSPTPEQRVWQARYIYYGYYAVICKGWDRARIVIEEYLSWPATVTQLG